MGTLNPKLMGCVWCGLLYSFRVSKKLMELGADVSAVDYNNVSVLNLASRFPGNEQLCNLLLQNEMCQVRPNPKP